MSPAMAPGRVVTLRRERRLPIPGQVLVEVGQRVQPDSVIASAELPGAQIPVNVAYRLSIDPEYLTRYLRKQVGDQVEAGEALAVSGGLFQLVREAVQAPRSGVVESIDRRTGIVIIREPSIKVRRQAYLAGRVVELLPQAGVIIEATVQAWSGVFGVGGERHGRLLIAGERPEQLLTPEGPFCSLALVFRWRACRRLARLALPVSSPAASRATCYPSISVTNWASQLLGRKRWPLP